MLSVDKVSSLLTVSGDRWPPFDVDTSDDIVAIVFLALG